MTPTGRVVALTRKQLLFEIFGLQMLRAIWQYRGFVLGMVSREFRARYLNSLLGSVWAVLNPLAMIVIYTVIFSQVMGVRLPDANDTLAYSLYLCAGILPWGYFVELITRSQTVFLEHAPLLKKMRFPRITLPVILLLSSTINFLIIFVLFLVFLVLIDRFPGWPILAFIPLLALQQALALGIGILLGTINVFFRDVAQFVGVVLQFWFWFTPIVYSIAIMSETTQRVFELNPMFQLVSAYQQIILNAQWPHWAQLQPQLVGSLVLLGFAFFVFYRLSGEIVDEI